MKTEKWIIGKVYCDSSKETLTIVYSTCVWQQLSIEPGSPNILLSCGEDGQVIEIDLRMDNGYRYWYGHVYYSYRSSLLRVHWYNT